MIQTLADALEQRGYTTLTPVQNAVTKPDLDGADLLVSAQTGSGKTVGFGLAIAPTLLGDTPRFGPAGAPLALIIAPTRELALQVKRELAWLYQLAGAVVASCVGGMDMRTERRALEQGAHIVVATPGRLRDHIQRGGIDLGALRAVVLDEADEMLDLGFREDLEFILGAAPETRRTLMFSATVPPAIATLARSYQKDAVRVTTAAETSQHADIEYRALNVAPQDAENAIINVLRYYDAQNAIVFCNTRAMVNRLTTRFSNRGFSVVALSGELSQNERTHALQAMRDGRARVCVATDVAARGIDLPNLELVIHAELPTGHETLLHRSGRTGRAGRKGVSALIVPGKARRKAERLLRSAKLNAEWAAPPSADEVLRRDEERLLADPVWDEAITEDERDFVDRLIGLRDPEQIAAAYLRLYRARYSAPEELAAPGTESAPRPRVEFGPSTWFSVSVGRSQNAEARWLLPMLCRSGNISKDDIGAIRVQQDETFVELSQTSVAGFLAAIGPAMVLDEGATLRQLDRAPGLTRGPRPAPGPRPGGKPPRHDKPAAAPRPAPAKPAWEPAQSAPAGVEPPKPRHEKTWQDKPRAEKPRQDKPRHEKSRQDAAPTGDKPAPRAKPAAKPGAKPAVKPFRGNPMDASKRYSPDGKPAKGPSSKSKPRGADKGAARKDGPGGKPATSGKPKVAKGGNAIPRRGKPKPR
ncbi:DEAD/DEAH box helicase [Actibacterium sp. D379-3]